MNQKWMLLRGCVWFVAAYHFLVGVVLLGPVSLIQWLGSAIGGMKMTENPEFYYLARPLGTYLLSFALMMALAAYDPVKNRAMLTIGIVLFGLRIFQRAYYLAAMDTIFNVSIGNNLVVAGIVLLFAVFLGILRLNVYREMHPRPATA